MTAEELTAASAKAAADRVAAAAAAAAAAATDQAATNQAAEGTAAQQVDSAVEAANDWITLGVESVASGIKLAQVISGGSRIATRLVMLRDEAAVLGRLQEVDDLHEAVFQHSVRLGNGLAGVESSTQNTVLLLTSIEGVDVAFDELVDEYERDDLTLPEARDGVTVLLGAVKQLSELITQIGSDGTVAATVAFKEAMQKFLGKLNEAGAQSAIITRILARRKK